MEIIKNLTANLIEPGATQRVNVMQGDTGRIVAISLYNNSEPWTDGNQYTAYFSYKTPSGESRRILSLDNGDPVVTVSGNVASVTIPGQATAETGNVPASVVFVGASEEQVSLFPFKMVVVENPAEGATVPDPLPDDEYSQLLSLNAKLRTEIAVERARINQFTTLPNGSTTGDAELADIRVDVYGRIHGSAGQAVRHQIENINIDPKNTSFFVWKNLFDEESVVDGYFVNQANGKLNAGSKHHASGYIAVKPNTSYICSPKNSAFRYAIYNSNKDFISGAADIMGFTTPENAAYIRVSYSADTRIPMQVEEGVAATDYVPYGETYIKPEYIKNEDIIKPEDTSFFVYKNLLDESALIDGYFVNQANGKLAAHESYKASDYIAVKPNTEYACGPSNFTTNGSGFRYAIYDNLKRFITGGVEVGTFTTPENAAYVRVSYVKTATELQIEEGSVPTNYVPYGTRYIDPQYIQPNTKGFLLNLPDKIYALVGEELNIYFDNLVDGHDTDYVWDVVCPVGMHMERCFRLVPNAAGNHSITISATNREGVTVSKTARIYIADTAANDGVIRSVIILGDSTTANGIAVTKLNENFTSDVMGLTTLGTMGTAPNNHEGRSGWKFATYFTSGAQYGIENLFYNPNTDTFDAQYYFDNSGIAVPDYFIINLGINDIFGATNDENLESVIGTMNEHCNHIIQSVQSAAPNTKVCVALTIPPNYSQDAFAKDYYCNQNRARYKRNNVIWVNNLIGRYAKRESEGIYLIPIHTNLDTKYNMGMETIQVNKRNTVTYDSPPRNSGVHPVESGYWQIADAYWFFLKNQV